MYWTTSPQSTIDWVHCQDSNLITSRPYFDDYTFMNRCSCSYFQDDISSALKPRRAHLKINNKFSWKSDRLRWYLIQSYAYNKNSIKMLLSNNWPGADGLLSEVLVLPQLLHKDQDTGSKWRLHKQGRLIFQCIKGGDILMRLLWWLGLEWWLSTSQHVTLYIWNHVCMTAPYLTIIGLEV